jgi:hypothetical protein
MSAPDLTTLANVKAWLNIANNDNDALLARLITAVSTFAQSWMNRNIAVASYVEKRSGHGGQVMVTSDYPVLSVTSVTVNGLPVTGYTNDEVAVYMDSGKAFARGKNNVVLSYSAGYAVIPTDLEQAVIETVALRFKERERIGQSSKGLAGETTSFIIKDFPPSAQSVFQNYKKVIPLR